MTAVLILVLSTIATAALAHPSLVSHAHPHGVSGLVGIDTILLAALAAAATWAVAEWRRK